MFCNVNKVIKVMLYIKQEETASKGDLNEDKIQSTKQKEYLENIPQKALEQCKRAYQMLIHLTPGLKSLINDPSKLKECSDVIRKMNKAIKLTRSDDPICLRDKIGLYAVPNPTQAAMSPPIYLGSKSQLRFNHPVLAWLLCPISALSEFQEDPKGTQQNLIAGKINMPAMIYPVFLWEENGNSFDEKNIIESTLTQFQVMWHIYTGPSTSLGEDSHGTCACNADLHDMDNVEAVHLAYSCIQLLHSPPTLPPRNVSPPPTSPPYNVSPPPTSPPCNNSPDLSVPITGPSKQAPWIDRELLALEDDALVDISNTKSSSSAKSTKKKGATTKNRKKQAVLSKDEDAPVMQTQHKSGHKNRRK
ncbi:hypothetical protein BDN67DRAFT_1017463 [Paxillus ammoniavirescens]|nr:hypothetical protein BDN67DRAFT_1017463 [Paxillus ammoniavirescens]